MIMLADRTGEVPKFASLPSLKLFDLRCLADLECWTLDLTSPTTASLSLTATASSRQVFLKADKSKKQEKTKLLFPQASHMSEAHLPLETAADVVELLR